MLLGQIKSTNGCQLNNFVSPSPGNNSVLQIPSNRQTALQEPGVVRKVVDAAFDLRKNCCCNTLKSLCSPHIMGKNKKVPNVLFGLLPFLRFWTRYFNESTQIHYHYKYEIRKLLRKFFPFLSLHCHSSFCLFPVPVSVFCWFSSSARGR